MIDFGLSKDERASYRQALRDNHKIQLDVSLLNQNEEHIDNLKAPISRVLEGEVTVDLASDVTRSLSLTLLDENHQLRFEANSPAFGAVYLDRFVAVRYEVYVGDLDDWVSCPVFWGPITGFSRTGATVTLEAMGKEALLLDPHFATVGYTLNKGMPLDEAIKRVARKAGETRFQIPELSHQRLRKDRSVTAQSQPWQVLTGGEQDASGKRIAGLVEHGKVDRMAFYDGRGRLTVRKRARRRQWTFAQGRDLLVDPSVEYDLLAFRNTVDVRGGKPKGKKPAHGRATLRRRHPLSPGNLARNGFPRYMTTFVEADQLQTDKECDERAKETLKKISDGGVTASFECLPNPMLEEGDRVRLQTDDWDFDFTVREFVLPLTAAAMSVGPRRKLKRIRRGKPKHRHFHAQHHKPGQASEWGRG